MESEQVRIIARVDDKTLIDVDVWELFNLWMLHGGFPAVNTVPMKIIVELQKQGKEYEAEKPVDIEE